MTAPGQSNARPESDGQRRRIALAVDAHGGDRGLGVTVPAARAALAEDRELEIRLVGLAAELEPALQRPESAGQGPAARLTVYPAESALPMDVRAVTALRKGEGSSLWEALRLVAEGRADGCVSGGNTGAIMALAVRLLGMLPGVERPVLMGYLPHRRGFTAVLDLGANLSVNERQLVQFAVMGSVAVERAGGRENPRVALLNVGHEDSKGHVLVQAANALLRDMPLNYIGFVEGHDLFNGKVDVAVCDGFSGNLILKSIEGLARMIAAELTEALSGSLRGRLGARLARPALRGVLARLDPSAHNGAPLLGLRGVVIKSHGHADVKAFSRAIMEAARAARIGIPQKIDSLVQQYHLEA